MYNPHPDVDRVQIKCAMSTLRMNKILIQVLLKSSEGLSPCTNAKLTHVENAQAHVSMQKGVCKQFLMKLLGLAD